MIKHNKYLYFLLSLLVLLVSCTQETSSLEFRSEKLCEIAINKDGDNIIAVPDHMIDMFYEQAVERGCSLMNLGLKNITNDAFAKHLCFLAVKARGLNALWVPAQHWTLETAVLATEKNCEKFIPQGEIRRQAAEYVSKKLKETLMTNSPN